MRITYAISTIIDLVIDLYDNRFKLNFFVHRLNINDPFPFTSFSDVQLMRILFYIHRVLYTYDSLCSYKAFIRIISTPFGTRIL